MRSLNLLIIVVLAVICTGKVIASNLVEEEVLIESMGVHLSGTIFSPAGKEKAVIVLIQGSGEQKRLSRLAKAIALRGFVVFTYDKRGVGGSEGVYEGKNNVSATNLNLLGDDAAAAIAKLRGRPALRGLPLGLLGISQAGWIGPLAAIKVGGLNFMGFWGGPICKVSEQLRFQKTRNSGDRDASREGHLTITTSILPGSDIDPVDSLKNIHIPVMWMFGGADTQVPVTLSISRLESLIAEGHPEFVYRLYPGEAHPALTDQSLGDMLNWVDAVITTH